MRCIYTWSVSASPETNTRTTQEISAPDQSWGGCDNPTPNWPYQGHKFPYLVPMTIDCLPALWPDSVNWAHTPGMYSVATKLWWVLHNWLIEDHLWDDPRGLHNIISERSWILLSRTPVRARQAPGVWDRFIPASASDSFLVTSQ